MAGNWTHLAKSSLPQLPGREMPVLLKKTESNGNLLLHSLLHASFVWLRRRGRCETWSARFLTWLRCDRHVALRVIGHLAILLSSVFVLQDLGRRSFLVLLASSHQSLLPGLLPVTQTVRNCSVEYPGTRIALSRSHGMMVKSLLSFDNLHM